jgi:multiple sugar transport system substrate-binding protein
MFDEAGLDYPTADWTWDDFMAAARTLTTEDHYGFVQPSTYAGRGYSDYLQWLWGAGGEVLNAEMTEALVDSPEAVDALEFVINMFDEGIVPPHGQYDDVSQEDLFMRGGVAMCACRATTVSKLRSDFPDVSYGLVLPPKGPSGNQISFADWGFFSMAEASPHKEAAWTWLKYITSKDITIKYIEQIGLTPAMKDTGLFEDDPKVYFFVENVSHVKNIPIHPQIEEILQVWWTEVEAAIQGSVSAEVASNNAAEAIDAILQE